ncbi:winged helix-turn-helix transcriptional regulator [Hyphomicrobium sp.]|uniref:winged helix-turn-helix transcriptional regulator n=1 Tax=Hyphomicrobium sp. TaxID=82 RepID=UPI0025C51A33|nr:winged helix-turn-helix transcriptional regulator [Hyphomicrobium sp.]MCC7250964.1 winged helix-turn-helix transcriptional regulator [Hyphomicrobium sp.]
MSTPRNSTVERREQAEDAIVLGLLDAVEHNATVTQRHLAHELGIALGLANTYLRRCIRKGLLKATEIPTRRYAYYVTPQGFAEKSRLTARYLSASFDFMRRARAEVGELFAEGVQRGEDRFVLVGPGDLADVALLVAPRAQARIVATFPGARDKAALAAALGGVAFDRVMITATEHPQDVFNAAVAAFGAQKVCAPKLLRVRAARSSSGGGANE